MPVLSHLSLSQAKEGILSPVPHPFHLPTLWVVTSVLGGATRACLLGQGQLRLKT